MLKYLSKKTWLVCCLLVGVSVVLQLLYVAETNKDIAFSMPIIDGSVYHRSAIAAMIDHTPDDKPFWQPPMYQWWMGCVYRIVGVNPLKLRYAQCVFPVIVVLLTFSIGLRIGGLGVGFIAGLLTAFSGPLIFYYGQFFPTGLAVALDMLVLWLLLRAWDKDRRRDWLFCGVGLGVASLAVPNVLVLALVVVMLLASRLLVCFRRVHKRCVAGSGVADGELRIANDEGTFSNRFVFWKLFQNGAVFVVGICICVLPVTIRNVLVSGQVVPISTNGGINLFIGNNPSLIETMAIRPGIDWDRLARKPFEYGVENEAQAQSWFIRKVVGYISENSWCFLKGVGYKTRLLLTGVEVPRNVDIYVFGERSKILGCLVWRIGKFGFPFSILLPLAILGIFTCRQSAYVRILFVCLVLYAFSVIFFFPTARYRAPLIPVLAIFAGMALLDIIRLLLRKEMMSVLFRVVGVCLVVVVLSLPIILPASDVDFAAELDNALGTALEVRGYRSVAMNYYRNAVAKNDASYEGYYNLANALRLEGELDEALECYRKVVELRPDHDRALANMGITLAQKGKVAEAIQCMERAIEYDNLNVQTYLSLGACYVRAKKLDDGVKCLEKALLLEPSCVSALQNLMGAFYVLKRFDEAVEAGRKALVLEPDNASVHNNIGMALISLGRKTEGRMHIERAAVLKGAL